MSTFSSRRVPTPIWKALLIVLSAAFAASATAQGVSASAMSAVAERFPSGSIRSVAQADAALAEAASERADIDARYLREEQACHPKFFATSCMEDAKERRRLSLYALRPVEIEANTFKRRARVAERDKALAERLANAGKGREERAGLLEPSGAAAGAIPETTPREPVAAIEDSSRKVQTTLFSDREEKRAAKQRPLQVEDTMEAEKRARNITAYEKKKRDALARQKKVAERKAEKERKRQEKQGGDPMPE